MLMARTKCLSKAQPRFVPIRQNFRQTPQQNARAIRFYEREGFDALGEDTYTIGALTFEFHLMFRRVKARPA